MGSCSNKGKVKTPLDTNTQPEKGLSSVKLNKKLTPEE